MLAIGSVAIANGNAHGDCENCHDDEPTLCHTVECSSNQVCSGDEGVYTKPDGSQGRWVEAECVDKEEVQ